MTDDFVTRLQLQLREAATREQARGSRRLVPALRGRRVVTPRPVAAVAAAVLVLIAAGLIVRAGDGTRIVPPAPAAPRVLATFGVGENPTDLVGAFGAVWTFDRADGTLLRVDPGSRKVTARVAVGDDARVAAGPDAVYTADIVSGTVTRVDPQTARATARRRLGVAQAVLPLIDAGRLWAVGVDGAARLDPATLAPQATIALHGGFKATGWALVAGDLWALQADGRLHHFDAATGAPRKAAGAPRGLGRLFSSGGAVFGLYGDHVLRLDPASGRVLWRSAVAGAVGATAVRGDLLWAHVAAAAGGHDRLVAFDAHTGRQVAATSLREFGSSGLARVGDHLWLTTPAGKVVVLGW
jgi:outer membrane protein assembly factor BamB